LKRQVRINAVFLFPALVSLGFKSGTPFLPELAKVCQSYFLDFLTTNGHQLTRIEANRFDFFLILVLLLVIEDALQIS
jgi:hypothetical protein